MEVISNYHARPTFYGWELTEKERKEFDYYNDEEIKTAEFFRFKGEIYDLAQFMYDRQNHFHGWDGYMNDSFYSGVLVKYPDDPNTEGIIVGWFIS